MKWRRYTKVTETNVAKWANILEVQAAFIVILLLYISPRYMTGQLWVWVTWYVSMPRLVIWMMYIVQTLDTTDSSTMICFMRMMNCCYLIMSRYGIFPQGDDNTKYIIDVDQYLILLLALCIYCLLMWQLRTAKSKEDQRQARLKIRDRVHELHHDGKKHPRHGVHA